MPNINDFEHASINNSWTINGRSGDNAALTVTKAAEANGRHVVVKVDVSYSTSTVTGEVQVKFATTIKGRKDVHGAGAIDFGQRGLLNPTKNEAVSAEFPAGGAGVFGDLSVTGFTVYD